MKGILSFLSEISQTDTYTYRFADIRIISIITFKFLNLKYKEYSDKKAQYIYNKISGYLKEKNIFNKVLAVCTYFKKELRSLIFFHCLAHKISLVSNDLNLRFEYVRYFQSIVYELIKFFINSPKKIKILDDYQEESYDEVS